MRHDDPKSTADVAVTGRARPLNLTARDREMLRFTDEHLNPPPRRAELKVTDKHD